MKKRVNMAIFGLMACTGLFAEDVNELALNQEQEECCDYEEEYYEWPPRRRRLFPIRVRSYNYASDEIIDRRGASHWPSKREGDLYEDLSR